MSKSDKNNSLFKAVNGKDLQAVKKAIENGFDVNYRDDYDNSALIIACQKKLGDIATELLENKAKIDLPNKLGQTALIVAASKNDCGLIKILLKYKADINYAPKSFSPLMAAASCFRYEAVSLLIKRGANFHQKESLGKSALNLVMEALESDKDEQGLKVAKILKYIAENVLNDRSLSTLAKMKSSSLTIPDNITEFVLNDFLTVSDKAALAIVASPQNMERKKTVPGKSPKSPQIVVRESVLELGKS